MSFPVSRGSLLLLLAIACVPCHSALGQGYQVTDLVSDVPGMAPVTDPNLKNPWGISFSATSPFWVSDQATNVSTLYGGTGTPVPLVVSVPGSPTGQVFNIDSSGFKITNGATTAASTFLFAGLDGSISGWNPTTGNTAINGVKTAGAVYTGLAIANNNQGSFLYAANSIGGIDVYDSTFQKATLAGDFTDPNLAVGLTPYNVQNVGGLLYVTYATAFGTPAGGTVAAFNTDGTFVRSFSGGTFADPWGVALAPQSFGQFGGDLLIGNKDSGQISAYDPTGGQFLGTLNDSTGKPLVEGGLWGLTFGNGGSGGSTDTLYFAAGINGEKDGLFGSISPAAAPEPSQFVTLAFGVVSVAVLARRRRKAGA